MFTGFLADTLTSATISTVLVGALAYLTRYWISVRLKNAIKHEYDGKLETHKAQLKAQTEVELERLRSQLAISAAERQIVFTELHEKRAEVIAETYSLLKDLHLALGDYVKIFEPTGDKPKGERREAVVESHKAFAAYYPKKRIFLPSEAATRIDKINETSVSAFYTFFYEVEMVQAANGDGVNRWLEIFQTVKGQMSDALDELEGEFRSLLGDES